MTSDEGTRLHFVVRRFEELKGLRMAMLGVAWALAFVASRAFDVGRMFGEWTPWIAILGSMVPVFAGAHFVDRYYDVRFGRVRAIEDNRRWFLTFILVALVTVGIRTGLGLVRYLAAIGAFFLWLTIRDWPCRRHGLLTTCASWMAAVIALASGAPSNDDVVMSGFAITGLGLLPMGLLDHRLLVDTLPGLRRRDTELESATR